MRQFRIWLGTAISLAFLAWLLWNVDPAELLAALRQVRPAWLLVGVAVFGVSIGVRVLRWQVILAGLFPIPNSEAGELLVIGAAANNILPARTGEIVRAALLQRRHGGSLATALGTIVVERVFDGLALALLLATALVLLPANGEFAWGALLAGAVFGSVGVVLALLALWPAFVRRVIAALCAVPPARIGDRLRRVSDGFLDGLILLGGPRAWALVALASVLTWSLEAAAYWAAGLAFGFELSPLVYLVVCGAANLSVAVPSTSGGIGPYEKLASAAVVQFGGIGASAGAAYAITVHAMVLLPLILLGLLLLWRRDLNLRTLSRTGQPDAPSDVPPPDALPPDDGDGSSIGVAR